MRGSGLAPSYFSARDEGNIARGGYKTNPPPVASALGGGMAEWPFRLLSRSAADESDRHGAQHQDRRNHGALGITRGRNRSRAMGEHCMPPLGLKVQENRLTGEKISPSGTACQYPVDCGLMRKGPPQRAEATSLLTFYDAECTKVRGVARSSYPPCRCAAVRHETPRSHWSWRRRRKARSANDSCSSFSYSNSVVVPAHAGKVLVALIPRTTSAV